MNASETDYDVLVIGSGFGGSVSALRLSEKGYRVGVLDMGRRWKPEDFPATTWQLRDWLWMPRLGMTGPMRISWLRDTTVMSAVGVGGGSLIYANTLYDPLPAFYTDRQWAHITDWEAELAPYYDQAKRMLGVAQNPITTPADLEILKVAEQLGVADTFHRTDVGVFFGEPGKTVPDPYFGGAGPDRAGCTHCAQCMTGCPHNAKNTLETNYLYLAEKAGTQIHPLTQVVDVRSRKGGGYEIDTIRAGRWVRKERRTFTAEQVIFAAASLGTQRLLHKLRDTGSLPGVSDRLGELTRTNSEAILAAKAVGRDDLADGIALTSSIHPTPDTHIEVCHYGKGSNTLYGNLTPLVDGSNHRFLRWLGVVARNPLAFLRSLNVRHASERSILVIAMQALDNSLTTYRKRGLFGVRMTTKQGQGDPNPVWIPEANKVTRLLAENMGGDALGMVNDLFNISSTAHFIGGCAIGDSPKTGVVDPFQRLYGQPGVHVVDGSTISANLGVNPSLTITAQSERAMAFWPNNGQADPRPPLGTPYQRIQPVPPANPTVPAASPGALRLPIVEVS
jgi:cholesterol oxidase